MSTSLEGPLVSKAVVGGDRAMRSRAPLGLTDPGYFVFFDDFRQAVVTTEAGWTAISDTGTTAVVADAPNGVIKMSSGSATENEGCSIQSTEELFDISSGNEIWFETRILLTDADQTDVFAGFTTNFATNPEAVLTASDRIGFTIVDESATIICNTERSDAITSKACTGSTVDGLLRNIPATVAVDAVVAGTDPDDVGWLKLGIHVYDTNDSGGGTAEFYVNDVLVCVNVTNIPDDEYLAVALMNLNGEATDNAMYVDYIWAAGTR